VSILIAEDNVAQRHYLRAILEREFASHAPVIEAADGEETVALALKHKPDVSILRYPDAPNFRAFKAARAIWRDFPSRASFLDAVSGRSRRIRRVVKR